MSIVVCGKAEGSATMDRCGVRLIGERLVDANNFLVSFFAFSI